MKCWEPFFRDLSIKVSIIIATAAVFVVLPAMSTKGAENPKSRCDMKLNAPAAGTKTYPYFSIKLPPRWILVRECLNDFCGLVSYAGPDGAYFTIEWNCEHGYNYHAIWKLAFIGDRIQIEKEEPRCQYEPDPDSDGEGCLPRNGHLEIVGFCDIYGKTYTFYFGNELREINVDLEVLRTILKSFRPRGQVKKGRPNPPVDR